MGSLVSSGVIKTDPFISSVSPLKVVVFLRLLFLREFREILVLGVEGTLDGAAESLEGTAGEFELLIVFSFKIHVLCFSRYKCAVERTFFVFDSQ